MQQKVVKHIIKDIDNTIYQALNIGYNRNTCIPSFSSTNIIQPDESGIIYSTKNILLNIRSEKSTLPVTKIEYRIPQTRIYITYLQNEAYYVRIFQFFNQVVLIVEYLESKNQQIITLESVSNPIVIQYPENRTYLDKSIKLSDSNIFIVQISESTVINLEKLPDYVNNCISEEIKSYPISRIQTDNFEFLKELDQNWALLRTIKQNNQINADILIENNFSDLIWIQEIYILLGWFDLLVDFYDDISRIGLSPQHMKTVTTTLSRCKRVCKVNGIGHIPLQFDNTISENEIDGQFLNILIRSTEQPDNEIYELIQHKWNYLHNPAVRLKFQQLILENPDEYIAFAILALQYRFWWHETLDDIILKNLPEKKKNIYKLVTLLTKLNIVRYKKDSIYYSRFLYTDHSNSQIQISNSITKKDTTRNKEQYSSLVNHQMFYIRINKNADFEYFPKSDQIKVWPRSFNPFVKKTTDCILTITDFSLHLPLIWDQFTVEFNKCRFKFLRKKDRFQVTIKFAQSISEIQVGEEYIKNNHGPVEKYYIPIKRSKSEINISAYNTSGAKLRKNCISSNPVVIKGIGYNVFGILNNHFRVHPDGQRKSYDIDLDEIKNKPINFNREKLVLRFTASKFDPINLQLDIADPFILKLLNTNISELFHKLKIYINSDIQNSHEVENLFMKTLGFVPPIEHISELIPNRNNIICVISNSIGDQYLSREIKFKIATINNKSRQTAMWINPEHLSYLFSEAFFTSLYD